MLNLDEPFRNQEIYMISLFFSLFQICVLKVKKFFMYFFGDILRLGSAYFADPDPGSQNLADPAGPDPKHWLMLVNKCKHMT